MNVIIIMYIQIMFGTQWNLNIKHSHNILLQLQINVLFKFTHY